MLYCKVKINRTAGNENKSIKMYEVTEIHNCKNYFE